MTNLPERRRPRSWLSDITDAVTGFPSWGDLRPMLVDPRHAMRLEEEIKDGHYLIRAEIPGVYPAKDIDITICDHQLSIKAERTERAEASGRSEFHYGSFIRTVALPAEADADDITATYDNGILTVDVGVPAKAAAEVKHVAVQGAG